MNDTVLALTVFDDGSGPALYAGGDFTKAEGITVNLVAKWDGSGWVPLGSGVFGSEVGALTVFDDGNGPALYAGGRFSSAGGVEADNLAKWDGSSWSAIGSGVEGSRVHDLTIFDDGGGAKLFAGGSFQSAGGVTVNNLARWNGSSWAPITNGVNTAVDALTVFDDGGGPALYAAGYFTTAGALPANRIARWSGSSWEALGSGLDDDTLDLAVFDDGSGPALYAGWLLHDRGRRGGELHREVGRLELGLARPRPERARRQALAVFDDGNGPGALRRGCASQAGGVVGGQDREVGRDELDAAWRRGGRPRRRPCRFSTTEAVRRFTSAASSRPGRRERRASPSGTARAGVPSVVEWTFARSEARAAFDDGNGPALLRRRILHHDGGIAADNIAKWDGASWSPVGGGMDGSVHALTVHDDGGGSGLYAGGRFTTAGGLAINRIAKWDGSSWAALGGGMVGLQSGETGVYALSVHDDGAGPALYAGGSFTSAVDSGDSFIAKWGCERPAPTTYCTAGTSASGCQALLSATGTASATASSGFTLSASTVEGQKDGLFFFGTNGQQANPWGNGTSYQCVVPPVVRTPTTSGVGTIGLCDGSFALDLERALVPELPQAAKNPGAAAVVQAQLWYRDPASTSNQTTSLSDAIEFVVAP